MLRAPALQALFVTFLWSTSWVLIKLGLEDLPALTFAGMRYALAAVVLWGWAAATGRLGGVLGGLDRRSWTRLLLLGLVMYTLTQGAQFLALSLLPANTVSLVLSLTPAVVAVASTLALGEPASGGQWVGIGIMLAGASLFLLPVEAGAVAGLAVAGFGTAANATASLLGRAINREVASDPLAVTLVSMTAGSAALLATGLAAEPAPSLDPGSWAIVAWLAVVNTAFAFTLWNHTLRRLTAAESSVINNTMLIQIAALAWIFLGESLDARRIVGLVAAALGAVVVSLRRRAPAQPAGGRSPTPR